MSSLVAVQPGEIKMSLSGVRAAPIIGQMQGRSSPVTTPKVERGRLEGRDTGSAVHRPSNSNFVDVLSTEALVVNGEHREKSDHEQDADGEPESKNGNSSNDEGGPNRKRRRSRKGLDKKFECPTEGCGKSYSRAEHL